jgi:U3 small nucleolar RNA-associated protein 15
VRWWDVTAGEQLFRLDGHSDYVRSSACSPAAPDTWATGAIAFRMGLRAHAWG